MDRKKRQLGKDGKATAKVVSPAPGAATKSLVKSQELFQQGEELYTLGLYQQAIHVWTRILFLERGDVRAKAAIERAKRAVSERQRELDAELAAATKALERGDVQDAAARVRHVLTVDPRHREGHQLAETIGARKRRNESTKAGAAPAAEPRPPSGPAHGLPASKRGLLLRVSHGASPQLRHRVDGSPLKMVGFGLAVVLLFASGALYLHLNWDSIVSDGAFANGAMNAGGGPGPVDAVAPSASELHYYNGARLYAKGRYRQALAELSLVERDDAVFDRARSLILRIEQRLLRGGELSETANEPAPIVR